MKISNRISIQDSEIRIRAVRSQGAGGQNVNKVSSAVHLVFDIKTSSLPDFCKSRLLATRDSRITAEGVVVIKAQRYRTQAANREDALNRLRALILGALQPVKKRRATGPTRRSKEKRRENKTRRGRIKALRGRVRDFPDAS